MAALVGVIYIAPHLAFRWSLGDSYRGIPMMQTANEDEYLLRTQEILDGHPSLGSPVFFEYKNEPPLAPPVGEWFYALPAMALSISLVSVLTASRFLFPAILFFLVYLLVVRMGERGEMGERGTMGWLKMTGIVGALLVTLGYDLVDYHTLLGLLRGQTEIGNFLLWSRPVNPILGALFLFSFLLLLWSLMQRKEKPTARIAAAALFLALMIGSYFFSWGMALSILAILVLFLFLRREYKLAGTLSLVAPVAVIFSIPYWVAVFHASQNSWYREGVLRSGLFLTHYPLLNKLLLAALFVYLILLAFDVFDKRRKEIAFHFEHWHVFCLSFLFGGLLAYSQQIVTGRTIWPYHFVQYTIPLSMVALIVLFYHVILPRNRQVFGAILCAAAFSSLLLGVYTQAHVYAASKPAFIELQKARPLFDWLNAQEKDCVVLQAGAGEGPGGFDNIIPAFTHCNLYDSSWVSSLLPPERILHNYLVRMFLKGVTAETVERYVADNRLEARGRLFSNWKGLFGVPQFPDFSDEALPARIAALPAEYRRFYAQDMTAELQKYRLDVIISPGPLPEPVRKRLPTLKQIALIAGNFIYSF